jgi:hypothetical protein
MHLLQVLTLIFLPEKNMKQADGTYINKTLGNEIDFVTGYNMNSLLYRSGYSIMNANSSMVIAKVRLLLQWQILIKPRVTGFI